MDRFIARKRACLKLKSCSETDGHEGEPFEKLGGTSRDTFLKDIFGRYFVVQVTQ